MMTTTLLIIVKQARQNLVKNCFVYKLYINKTYFKNICSDFQEKAWVPRVPFAVTLQAKSDFVIMQLRGHRSRSSSQNLCLNSESLTEITNEHSEGNKYLQILSRNRIEIRRKYTKSMLLILFHQVSGKIFEILPVIFFCMLVVAEGICNTYETMLHQRIWKKIFKRFSYQT